MRKTNKDSSSMDKEFNNLVNLAEKEIYQFSLTSNKNYLIENILHDKRPDEVPYLTKLIKQCPNSTIDMVFNQPVLHVVHS